MKKELTEKQKGLLSEWIVVKNDQGEIKVTKRDNFGKMNYCDCFNDFGIKIGCHSADCYSLENSDSQAQRDLETEIKEQYGIDVYLEQNIEGWTVEPVDPDEFINDVLLDAMEQFVKEWQGKNENHSEVTAWNHWNGRNHRSIILRSDFFDCDVAELEDDDQLKILEQMPDSTPHMEGTGCFVETEDYIFSFDRWVSNPWYCDVEIK